MLRSIGVTALFVVLIQAALAAAAPFKHDPREAALANASAIAAAEIVAVIAVMAMLRRDGRSLRDIGLWQPATFWSWVTAIALGALTAYSGLSNPALHLHSKLGALFDPAPWHLATALIAGLAAGFCEEITFRGFVMQELARGGRRPWAQVIVSGILFGAAHAGLLRAGWRAALLVIVPTAILGMLYSILYLWGRRSLMPVIVSHFMNDFAVIPWLFLAVAAHAVSS